MDNFAYYTHHFHHLPTHQHLDQLCMPMNKDSIQKRCSLQIKKASSISIPASKASNVWIITSPTTAVPSRITLICPGEAPRSLTPWTPINILWLQPACSATSQHFHLPPCYESHEVTINISLNTANLKIVNISALEFRICQHLENHWKGTLLHHLVNIPSVPIEKLYKQMVKSNGSFNPFLPTDESIGETVSVWTLFSHAGIFVTAIGLLILAGLGIFCCYFFWCWPARLVYWPIQSGSMQYTIVDENVEAAPIYRCDSKVGQPIVRTHENHDPCIEWEPTWMESWQKQQIQARAVPASRSLDTTKIQRMQ